MPQEFLYFQFNIKFRFAVDKMKALNSFVSECSDNNTFGINRFLRFILNGRRVNVGQFRIVRNGSVHLLNFFGSSCFNYRLIGKQLTVINVIAVKNSFCFFNFRNLNRIVRVIGFQNMNCSVLSVLNIFRCDVSAFRNQLIYHINNLRISQIDSNIIFGIFLVCACHGNAFVWTIVYTFTVAGIAAPSKFITEEFCFLLSGMFLREVFVNSEFAVRKS